MKIIPPRRRKFRLNCGGSHFSRQIEGTTFFKDVMFANHEKGQFMLKVDTKSGGEAEAPHFEGKNHEIPKDLHSYLGLC